MEIKYNKKLNEWKKCSSKHCKIKEKQPPENFYLVKSVKKNKKDGEFLYITKNPNCMVCEKELVLSRLRKREGEGKKRKRYNVHDTLGNQEEMKKSVEELYKYYISSEEKSSEVFYKKDGKWVNG